MSQVHDFAEVLGEFVQRSGYNVCQLARLTGLPRMTLVNWLEGQVKKPRAWQDVVKVCRVLRLSSTETNQLLTLAGKPPLTQLQQQYQSQADMELLSFWVSAAAPLLAPFQAIPNLPTFVGRERLLATLQEWVLAPDHPTPLVLEGMAGVGKTALAARLAYLLRPHLPDGVLWLRPDLTNPMTSLELLGSAYGENVMGYADLGSRSQAVRGLLAHKRALLVLDNVVNETEIMPLLPPSGSCAVLTTTRRRNLTIAGVAARLSVADFSAETEATLALFRQFLGSERVAAEQEALLLLADWAGYLPLALDMIASRLAYEPGWTAAEFWARQSRAQNSLATLAFGERNLASVLATSYAALLPQEQQFFSCLASFSGREFSIKMAADVARVSVGKADALLKALFCLSFIRRGQDEQYRLPPVLQAFAEQVR
ncbi:MAG: hypothetical protein KDE56_08775 [Anaerolineales bacterium]|nr:hypothetical protein [Anaerolineales bacterium]